MAKLVGLNSDKSLNIMVAEHNGIEVLELINSPNYDKIITEFKKQYWHTFVTTVVSETTLTRKEAYAILAVLTDSIKED